MTALCSGKICTIFPEKGALNFWKACTIALEYSVQVISTASTILGVLFGSTYFSFGKGGFSKVVFYLSIAVFCVAFTYIIVLGIGSTLRYYYVQKIEDLLSLESEDSKFLHWGSYFAPIVTRNRKHIRSMHTLLFYVCYTLFI